MNNLCERVEVMDIRDEGGDIGHVIVFTGSGRGKTVAALGVACRLIGHGGRVIFIYFTGPQHSELGEVRAAAALGGSLRMIGIESEAGDPSYLSGFTETVETVREALALAHSRWIRECDLLVLDDIDHHLERGSIDTGQVVALIDDRPPDTSILLTGRAIPEAITKRADVISNFVQIKYPSQSGIYHGSGGI